MFNRFLGKKPESGSADGPPGSSTAAPGTGADASNFAIGGAPPPSSSATDNLNNSNAEPPKELQAVTMLGNSYSVRVSVNNVNVSPPGSDVEDEDMNMMEGEGEFFFSNDS